MFSFKNFFSGWGNWLTDNPEAAKMAKERAKACQDCIFSVKSKYLDWVGDDIKEIEGYVCDMCDGCPLSAKLRASESECEHPDGSKWKGISTSEC